jgi:hypothetical protein
MRSGAASHEWGRECANGEARAVGRYPYGIQANL